MHLTSERAARVPAPSLFDYDDYRRYLASWFAWAKIHRRMTHKRFAESAGLRSHTLLGMIIRGNRNLTPALIDSMAPILSLQTKEVRYFRALVNFNQAKDTQEKLEAFAHLQSLELKHSPHLKRELPNANLLLKDWYVPVIREYLKLPNIPQDANSISRHTGGKVSPQEVSDAIEALSRTGLLIRNEKTNRLNTTDAGYDFAPGSRDLIIRNYHSRVLNYAKRAAEEQEFQDRELSSLCVAVSSEKLGHIKERINEFRKELNLMMELSPGETPDQVIIFNLQLLQILEDKT